MFNKINILNLIREHLDTFYLKNKTKENNKQTDIKSLLFCFIVPIIISLIMIFLFGNIGDTLSNSLLVCLSILSPLMFGFFPFIYDLIDNNNISAKSRNLISEFKANVLFTILLSFSSLAIILIWTLVNSKLDFCLLYFDEDVANWLINTIPLILSGIIYYLLFCLGIHILLIIQRFNFLIDQYNKFKKNKS